MSSVNQPTPPAWLKWAREIQSLCQTGLRYSESDYATARYHRLSEIAAEMVEAHTRLPKADILKNFRVQPGDATPKVDVRGAIVQNNQVLLVQERADQKWCLPGGWADVGETPSETVIREVREECGLTVTARKMIGVYDANRSGEPLEFYHAYKLIFLCQIEEGTPQASDETLAVDFFEFDRLPELSSNRTDHRHLKEVLAHSRDPQRPATFD